VARPAGRQPGTCSTVVERINDGPFIGHGRVPTVFWGADAPGAQDKILADRPAALILMGDWCVPAGTITKRTKTGMRITDQPVPTSAL